MNKPLIISTGMANDSEISEAVDTALKFGSGELTLLHCVSGYPAPAAEYNLRTLADMKKDLGCMLVFQIIHWITPQRSQLSPWVQLWLKNM